MGWAKDPDKRLTTLQTGNPFELRLLHVVPGDRRLEAAFHKRLKHAKVRTDARAEWFDGRQVVEFLAFVADLVDRMVAHYDGSGVAPGITPDWRTEVPQATLDRWSRISQHWIGGLTRREIALREDMKEAALEIEILRMRGEGGYELPEGIVLRQGPNRTDRAAVGQLPRLGLNRRKPEPEPVTVRYVEPATLR